MRAQHAMRIVVTGATGNVGSALLERLVGSGAHQVVGVVRRPPEADGPYASVRWVSTDLAEDLSLEALREAFQGADAVVHLAWGFQPSHDVAYLEALGLGGTRRVLAAIAAAGVPQLVHMSSVGAYTPKRGDTPVDESYPTGGVPSSWYSRTKAGAERLLDAHERTHDTAVARLRPGLIGHQAAGSALLRYAVPAVVPARALDLVPVLPLDRRLQVPMVHAHDVADAIVRVLERRASGPFNLAAEPPIGVGHLAAALDCRHVHVPAPVLRRAVSLSWHARLQQVDPGWVDLGYAVPLLDTGRARRELEWAPTVDAVTVLEQTVDAMRHARSGDTPALRPRSVAGQLARFLRRGPVSGRRLP